MATTRAKVAKRAIVELPLRVVSATMRRANVDANLASLDADAINVFLVTGITGRKGVPLANVTSATLLGCLATLPLASVVVYRVSSGRNVIIARIGTC